MIRLITIAATALTLAGASAASAQVLVPADPGYGAPYGYASPSDGYYGSPDANYGPSYRYTNPSYTYGGALSGQCSTDEGYGRRGSCESGGD